MLLKEIEKYAKEKDIPIMEPDGIAFLTDFIKKNNIKSILEIGSAIGYSAIKMAMIDEDILIDTIERDEERFNEALKNIEKTNLKSRINIIKGDALETNFEGKYDLIFIDAAKSQYINFFEKYKTNLKKNGYIFTDNLNFHGYTKSNDRIESRNLRQLVGKIRKYITFLENNSDFETEFHDIGDGISISKIKTKE